MPNPYEQYLQMFGPTQRMRTNFSDFTLPPPQVTGPGELSGVDTSGYGGPPLPPLEFGQGFGDDTAPPPMPPPQPMQAPPSGPPPIGSNPLMDPRIPVPSLNAPPPPEREGRMPFDVEAEMAKYQPEHAASDRFNQLISSRPEYQRPSALRTIASALSAFGPGGHQTGMAVMNEPNIRAQQEWKDLIGPAQQAANLERYQNVNERTLRYQTVTAQLRESADRARAENNERKAGIAEERMRIYGYKAKNPNVKIVKVPGGNLMFDDQKGNLTDSGISSGTMTRLDEIELGIEGRKEVAGVQHGHRMTEIEQRDENLTKQKGIPQKREFSPYGRGAGTGGESGYMKPTQQIAMEKINADRLKNTNPKLGKWVTWNGSHVEITPPDEDARPDEERSFWEGARTGPTQEEYDQISSAVYGPMKGDIAADKNRGAFTPPDPEAAKHNSKLPPNSPYHYVKNPNYRGKPGEDYWIPVRKQ